MKSGIMKKMKKEKWHFDSTRTIKMLLCMHEITAVRTDGTQRNMKAITAVGIECAVSLDCMGHNL